MVKQKEAEPVETLVVPEAPEGTFQPAVVDEKPVETKVLKVYAPDEGLTGRIHGVFFVNGVGETDNLASIKALEADGFSAGKR